LIKRLTVLNTKNGGIVGKEREKMSKLRERGGTGLERKLAELNGERERIVANRALDVVLPREREPTGWFSEMVIGMWEVFFAVPRRSGSAPITRKQMKLDEIDPQIEEMERRLRTVKALERWNETIDIALATIFQSEFTFQGYQLSFMSEVRDGRGVLASFVRVDGDRHIYIGATRLVEVQMRMICGNSHRWLNFTVGKTYRDYESLFATPIMCSQEKVAQLKTLSFEELKTLALGL
jgi:hypothetical protein